jgi:hypothetical protein
VRSKLLIITVTCTKDRALSEVADEDLISLYASDWFVQGIKVPGVQKVHADEEWEPIITHHFQCSVHAGDWGGRRWWPPDL